MVYSLGRTILEEEFPWKKATFSLPIHSHPYSCHLVSPIVKMLEISLVSNFLFLYSFAQISRLSNLL